MVLLEVYILGLYWLRQQGISMETRMFCLGLGLVLLCYVLDHGLWYGIAIGRLRILWNALQGAGLGWFLGVIAFHDALAADYSLLAGLLAAFAATTLVDFQEFRRKQR